MCNAQEVKVWYISQLTVLVSHHNLPDFLSLLEAGSLPSLLPWLWPVCRNPCSICGVVRFSTLFIISNVLLLGLRRVNFGFYFKLWTRSRRWAVARMLGPRAAFFHISRKVRCHQPIMVLKTPKNQIFVILTKYSFRCHEWAVPNSLCINKS